MPGCIGETRRQAQKARYPHQHCRHPAPQAPCRVGGCRFRSRCRRQSLGLFPAGTRCSTAHAAQQTWPDHQYRIGGGDPGTPDDPRLCRGKGRPAWAHPFGGGRDRSRWRHSECHCARLFRHRAQHSASRRQGFHRLGRKPDARGTLGQAQRTWRRCRVPCVRSGLLCQRPCAGCRWRPLGKSLKFARALDFRPANDWLRVMSTVNPTLPTGYSPVPLGHVANVATFLEMTSRSAGQPQVVASDLSIRRWLYPDLAAYRRLFRAVGENWLWQSRLVMPDDRLLEIFRNPDVEIYRLFRDETVAGLLELDFDTPPECELSFFGVVPGEIGKGSGRFLMAQAIACAWARPISRLWVHTCTF